MSWIHEDARASMPSALNSSVINHRKVASSETSSAMSTPREPRGHRAEANRLSHGYNPNTEYDASDSSETPRGYNPFQHLRKGNDIYNSGEGRRDPNISVEDPPEPDQTAPITASEEMENLHVLMPETMEALVLKQKWESEGLYGVGMLVSDAVPHVVQEITQLLDPQRRNLGKELSIGDTLCSVEDYPVEWANIDTIEQLVVGELGSSVQLTFRKKNTRDLLTITALRHRPVRVWERCERWYEVKDEYLGHDLRVDAGVVAKLEEIRRRMADGDGKLRDLLSDSNHVQTTLGFRVVLTSDDSPINSCVVKHVIPGSCADQVMGVKPGDEILEVNGQAVRSWDEKKLLESFRGSDVIGTKCALTVLRDGKEVEAEVARTNAFFAGQAEQLFQLAQQHAGLVHAGGEGRAPEQQQQLLESLRALTERCLSLEQQRVLNERLLAGRLALLQRETLTLITDLEASLRPVANPPPLHPLRTPPSPQQATGRSGAGEEWERVGGAVAGAELDERALLALLHAMGPESPVKGRGGEGAEGLSVEGAVSALREARRRSAGGPTPRGEAGAEGEVLVQWARLQPAPLAHRLVHSLAEAELTAHDLLALLQGVSGEGQRGRPLRERLATLAALHAHSPAPPPHKSKSAPAPSPSDDKHSMGGEERAGLLERQNRELLLELRRLQGLLGERPVSTCASCHSGGSSPRPTLHHTPPPTLHHTPRASAAPPPPPPDAPEVASPRRVVPAGGGARTPRSPAPLSLPSPRPSHAQRSPLQGGGRGAGGGGGGGGGEGEGDGSPAATPYLGNLLGVSAIPASSPTPPPHDRTPRREEEGWSGGSGGRGAWPGPPTVRPPGGRFLRPVSATLFSRPGPPGTIYYTTDGSRPSPFNYAGSGPSPLILQVRESMTLQAVAVEGRAEGPPALHRFEIQHEEVGGQMAGGATAGVGLLLEKSETSGLVRVKRVLPGGVAEADGGLRVRDVLLRVNNTPVHALELQHILELVKGPEGSGVRMELERRGPDGDPTPPLPVTVHLVRQRVRHQLGLVSTPP